MTIFMHSEKRTRSVAGLGGLNGRFLHSAGMMCSDTS